MEDSIERPWLWEVFFCGHCHDNTVEGYEHYHHTLAYIDHQFRSFKGKSKDLLALCGYKSSRRFVTRMREWLTLRDPVPLRFLKAIEADLYVMETALALDIREFHELLARGLKPKVFVICNTPMFSRAVSFPGISNEKEAIAFARSTAVMRNTMCLIEYPLIKTIWIEPDGNITTRIYPPGMKRVGRSLRFFFMGDMDDR